MGDGFFVAAYKSNTNTSFSYPSHADRTIYFNK